jgi:S-(hydroxymethyl)glutathione dehydrogenase / alcohol dehydrogenase
VVRAAVLTGIDTPLVVADIDLPEPGPGQVRVRLAAAGVCHSDLSLATGVLRQPVPAVLGHEGAGHIVAVGPDVDGFRPGDAVLLNWSPSCGACHFCRIGEPYLCVHAADAASSPYARLADADGTAVYPGLGTAAFAQETVVPRSGVLALPDGVPLTEAALLGCAVLTGYGAVHHAARVRAGETVAVFGLGGVGLSVVAAARLAGAGQIIAVDVAPAKEDLARAQGATDFLISSAGTATQVRALTGGIGADHAIECVGSATTIRTAWSSTRRGGSATVIGIGRADDQVSFGALELFHFARTLRGSVFGNCDPARDVPVLAGHVAAGRLDVSALVTDRIGLEDIPAAFDRMRAGHGGRSVIVF